MKNITMLQFRQNSETIIQELRDGEQMTLTYRGKPVAKLVPIAKKRTRKSKADDYATDPIYRLWEHAEQGTQDDETMTNEKIDQILYGPDRPCG